MAFTVTNPIDAGTNASANNDLGLKLYSNEVLAAFDRMNVFLPLVKNRTISGGISSQFIITGQASDSDVNTHTPGADVATAELSANERVISIDSRYYYSHFLDKLQDKLAQYDIRGELARQAAEALATKIDKAVSAKILEAAQTAEVVDAATGQLIQAGGAEIELVDGQGGTLTSGEFAALSAEAKGDVFVETIFAGNTEMNEKNVPADGRSFITTPANYSYIVQSQKAVNRDFTNGNGGIDSGNVLNIAGTPVRWTNQMPAGSVGLLFQEGCVGVVKAMDITSESNYIPEKLGDLLTSYYALGMGVLEPAKAVSFKYAAA